jgi:hypothetical protein
MTLRLAVLLALSLLSGCSPRIAFWVGTYFVSERDVKYRNEYMAIFDPQSDHTDFAKRQLTTAYTYAEILKRRGRTITHERLEKESERIEATETDKARLEKIKAVFGNDHEGYLRVYVLPLLAEREVYSDVYAVDPDLHREPQVKAAVFLKAVISANSQKTTNEISKSIGIDPYPMTISATKGLVEPQLDPSRPPPLGSPIEALQGIQLASDDPTRMWASKWIKTLKDGAFAPQILNAGTAWVVIQRVKKVGKASSDTYAINLYSFPKRPFSEWIRQQLETIAIRQ